MEVRIQGERWFPHPNDFRQDMLASWGDWGVDSEIGRLRAVLLHRPGPEIESARREPDRFRFKEPMDPGVAGHQHDSLAEVYRAAGAKVYYVEETRSDRPNAMFMRDLLFMTPEGAIIGRPAMAERRGEERHVAETVASLGVPIIKTVNGTGIFEGACAMWVDRETVLLGTGARTNEAGAQQVEAELRNIGVKDVVRFQIPYGHAHLDGLINIADHDKMMCFPWQTPYEVAMAFRERGFTILENPHFDEIKLFAAINFVALEPGKVVLNDHCPKTRRILEDAGVQVVEVDLTEIRKGWGAMHCMTAFLRRDPVD